MTPDNEDHGWQPLFAASTPSEEVAALADVYVRQSVDDLRQQLEADPTFTPAERIGVLTRATGMIRGHIRRTFEQAHARLKAGE